MRFNEFRRYKADPKQNLFAFVCDDDFLVEESRAVWSGFFAGNWVHEKIHVKEFEAMETTGLVEEARTPSLFAQSRILMIDAAEKLSRKKLADLPALAEVTQSSLKLVFILKTPKLPEGWGRSVPLVVIDPMKPAEVAAWLVERYKLPPNIARYIVENAGTELYSLHHEVEKLRTYVGADQAIDIRAVDASLLNAEEFMPYEFDDAIIARDYEKASRVLDSLLRAGDEHPLILGRISRVWRQILIAKGMGGKADPREIAAAAGVPGFKAGQIVAAAKKYEWKRLVEGFNELLQADRNFKTISPKPADYFSVLLRKLVG
jgi:DNA polymerase III delta subunit